MGEGRLELIGNRKFLLGGSGFTHVLDFPFSVLAGAFLFFPVILARYYVVQRLLFPRLIVLKSDIPSPRLNIVPRQTDADVT